MKFRILFYTFRTRPGGGLVAETMWASFRGNFWKYPRLRSVESVVALPNDVVAVGVVRTGKRRRKIRGAAAE